MLDLGVIKFYWRDGDMTINDQTGLSGLLIEIPSNSTQVFITYASNGNIGYEFYLRADPNGWGNMHWYKYQGT